MDFFACQGERPQEYSNIQGLSTQAGGKRQRKDGEFLGVTDHWVLLISLVTVGTVFTMVFTFIFKREKTPTSNRWRDESRTIFSRYECEGYVYTKRNATPHEGWAPAPSTDGAPQW